MPRLGFGTFRCARTKSDPQAREAFESFAAKVQADLPDAVRGKKIEVWRRHKVRVGRQGTLTRIRAGARALRVPDNITLMPLPPYAPQINPVSEPSEPSSLDHGKSSPEKGQISADGAQLLRSFSVSCHFFLALFLISSPFFLIASLGFRIAFPIP